MGAMGTVRVWTREDLIRGKRGTWIRMCAMLCISRTVVSSFLHKDLNRSQQSGKHVSLDVHCVVLFSLGTAAGARLSLLETQIRHGYCGCR